MKKCLRFQWFYPVILLLLFFPQAFSQKNDSWASKIFTGKVTDSKGESLEGVTVEFKGTRIAVATNSEGLYSISSTSARDTVLLFSSVSYITKEIRIVSGILSYNVQLEDAVKGLNDVVVIGYGSSRKKDLTGSVSTVNMPDLQKAPVASFENALAGRVAGVQVTASDGQPGSGSIITIRGGNSISQDNSPLYVIDGFPIENPDNNILNPAEIESIEVLKDASATAIYGARGANGVIIITTKKGKAGAPVVTYNTWIATHEVIKKQEMLSPYEFVKYELDLSPSTYTSIYLNNGKTVESYKDVKGIDWQDLVLKRATVQSHFITLNGGNDKTRYSLSGSVFDQDGIIINSGFKRYQGRVVLDQQINKSFKAGVNINYTSTKTFGQVASALSGENSGTTTSYLMFSVLGYRPVTGNDSLDASIVDDLIDPEVDGSTTDTRVNPVIAARNTFNPAYNNTLLANAYAEFKFLKNFTLRLTGGVTRSVRKKEIFNNSNTASGSPRTSAGAVNGVNGSVTISEVNSWVNENTLTYNKKINKDNVITVLGGFTLQKNTSSSSGFTAIQVPNESLGISGLDEGTVTVGNSSSSLSTLASFLGRVNYNFKSRYLFTVSFRADGTSRFAPGKRWGYFPSGSFAWRISQESFMKNIRFISDAKLRVSHGVTGNNRVSDFAYLSVLRQNVTSNSSNSTSGYYFNNVFIPGSIPTEVGNKDLKWESTAQTDVGLDLGFLNNRVSLTIDYYYKKTNDLLLNASLASSTGYLTAYKNIGSVSNQGIEFTLTTTNIDNGKFTWTSNFNIAFNRNRIEDLNYDQPSLTTRITSWNGNFNSSLPYIAKPGLPIASFYGFLFDGVYQYSDFDMLPNGTYQLKDNIVNNGAARTSIKPGDIKYKDINSDGVVDGSDQVITGNPNPVHIGGFSNNFSYKGFDLNIFFQWSYGNDILNANRIVFEGGEGRGNLNMYKSMEKRWTPDNPTNLLPRAGGYGPNVYSSRIIEDGSFLRLKTVALGYSIPSSFLKKVKINNIRVYLSGQNLITWTRYTGMDPEVSVRHTALTPGFDWSAYPKSRVFTAGINVTF